MGEMGGCESQNGFLTARSDYARIGLSPGSQQTRSRRCHMPEGQEPSAQVQFERRSSPRSLALRRTSGSRQPASDGVSHECALPVMIEFHYQDIA